MQTNYKNNAKYKPIRLKSKCSSFLYQLTRLQRLVQRPQIHQHTTEHHNSHRLRHHNYHHRWNHFDTFIPHIPHIKDRRKMAQQTTKEEELCKQSNQDTVRRLWCKKYRDIDTDIPSHLLHQDWICVKCLFVVEKTLIFNYVHTMCVWNILLWVRSCSKHMKAK